jgi:hypothetical protein
VTFVAPEMPIPFLFHWYIGVDPPFVDVAVKVTEVPEHTGLTDASIIIPTGGFCVVV